MSAAGRIVHIRDRVEGAVYIGRAVPGLRRSPFANPFVIGEHGTRGMVIARFREYLLGNPDLVGQLSDLRGKPLACWCRHDGEGRTEGNACHGDVILTLLAQCTDEELIAEGARR